MEYLRACEQLADGLALPVDLAGARRSATLVVSTPEPPPDSLGPFHGASPF
jgi:hypothetical protein